MALRGGDDRFLGLDRPALPPPLHPALRDPFGRRLRPLRRRALLRRLAPGARRGAGLVARRARRARPRRRARRAAPPAGGAPRPLRSRGPERGRGLHLLRGAAPAPHVPPRRHHLRRPHQQAHRRRGPRVAGARRVVDADPDPHPRRLERHRPLRTGAPAARLDGLAVVARRHLRARHAGARRAARGRRRRRSRTGRRPWPTAPRASPWRSPRRSSPPSSSSSCRSARACCWSGSATPSSPRSTSTWGPAGRSSRRRGTASTTRPGGWCSSSPPASSSSASSWAF